MQKYIILKTEFDITKCFHYDNAVKFAQGATRDYYIEIGEKSKAARNKFISKNKKRKNKSRIIFYTFFSIEILMVVFDYNCCM